MFSVPLRLLTSFLAGSSSQTATRSETFFYATMPASCLKTWQRFDYAIGQGKGIVDLLLGDEQVAVLEGKKAQPGNGDWIRPEENSTRAVREPDYFPTMRLVGSVLPPVYQNPIGAPSSTIM